VIVCALVASAMAGESCGNYFAEMSCRDGKWTVSEENVAKLMVCQNPKFYGEEGAQPVACRLYCNNAVFGVLDGNGEATLDIYTQWIDSRFPEDLKFSSKAHFNNCFDEYVGGTRLNKEADEGCERAKAFNKCAWELVPKLSC